LFRDLHTSKIGFEEIAAESEDGEVDFEKFDDCPMFKLFTKKVQKDA
jgi:hypothetical protein